MNIAAIGVAQKNRGQTVPYKRRFVEFLAGRNGDPSRPGVRVKVKQDPSYEEIYDAELRQYVKRPRIDMAIEMANAIEASRAYEANVTAMEVTKAMMNASLRLLA
jgi:flagellar basal-body rod protein FlgC